LSEVGGVVDGVAVALLTVSDTRTRADDRAGDTLEARLHVHGHKLIAREIVRDDVHAIRVPITRWIADPQVAVIITTGGTGITGRDNTPEAIAPLLEREIPGFGERLRTLSFAEVGDAALPSRAFAGIANQTLIFALPGSPGACITAFDGIIAAQLRDDAARCNLRALMPRLGET
jgi:molybdenum cofactor biosynthesis protein B